MSFKDDLQESVTGGMLEAKSPQAAGRSWLEAGKAVLRADEAMGKRFGDWVIEATAPVPWQRPRNAPMMPESVRAGLATAASMATPLNVGLAGLPSLLRLGRKVAGVTKAPSFVEDFLKVVKEERGGGVKPPPPPEAGGTGPPGGLPAIREAREVGPPEAGKWMDPNVMTWERVKTAMKDKLPADYWIATKVPESAVIGDVDRVRAAYTTFLDQVLTGPLNKTIQRYAPDDWIRMEHEAVSYWKAHGGTPEAVLEAISRLPEDAQDIFKFFQQRLPDEQRARTLLGLPEINEFLGPYLPRVTAQDWKGIIDMYQQGAPLAADLRTTLGGFQKSRVYDTYTDGQLGLRPDGTITTPTLYEDPRKAILMRMAASEKLLRTAQMIDELSFHWVLSGTPEAAAQMAVRRPYGQVTEVRGLPGTTTQKWYAPSREEAKFLEQNLTVPEFRGGRWASAIHLTNQLFRNPNLYNPLPHIVKNMGAKYLIATVNIGGNPARLAVDAAEYLKGTNPALIAQFDHVMPFAKTGRTPYEMLYSSLKTQPHQKVLQWMSYLFNNRVSSDIIFRQADPAMKYSLWKQYVSKGLSPVAAANQVTVDLVRYSIRSELIDIWKSVPMNFFVPWRTGSIMAVTKQFGAEPFKTLGIGAPYYAVTRPFRTALLLGTIDYLRDIHYRETGRTFHMPIDYYQGPIAKIWADPKQAANLVISLAALGPGGDMHRVLTQLLTSYDIAAGKEDKARLVEMFWGLSQIYGAADEMYKYTKDGKTEHLSNVLTAAVLAEHPTGGRKPERLVTQLDLGGRAPAVEEAEAGYERRKARRELMERRLGRSRERRSAAEPSLYQRLKELVQ